MPASEYINKCDARYFSVCQRNKNIKMNTQESKGEKKKGKMVQEKG